MVKSLLAHIFSLYLKVKTNDFGLKHHAEVAKFTTFAQIKETKEKTDV